MRTSGGRHVPSIVSSSLSSHPSLSRLLPSAPHYVAVDTSLLQWTLDCGTIPLVCPVGRDARGCSVMLDPTEVTAAISRALQPHKVMFLNNSGGLRRHGSKVRSTLLQRRPEDTPVWRRCWFCVGLKHPGWFQTG